VLDSCPARPGGVVDRPNIPGDLSGFGVKKPRRREPIQVMMGVTEMRGEVEELYRSEGARLWSAVRAYTGDPFISDDAVAEAFAQLLRRGDDVRKPGAWVWTTAFRIAARELQQRRAAGTDPPDTSYDPAMPDQRVLSAIARLSDRQRAAVVLHYYADRPVKEVADLLGTTASAVSVHLFRARKNLRDLLGDDL
jgi:RNA polymerase sigma factor (sigma-70 family)